MDPFEFSVLSIVFVLVVVNLWRVRYTEKLSEKNRKLLLVIVDLNFGVLTKPEREEYLRIRGFGDEEVQKILQKNIE